MSYPKHLTQIVILCCLCTGFFAGCEPDKETEALRQENAALRKAAVERDAAGTPPIRVAESPAPVKNAIGTAARMPPEPDSGQTAAYGLPPYPGSKPFDQPGTKSSLLTGNGMKIVLLESTDKIEPIVDFYTRAFIDTFKDPRFPTRKSPPTRTDRLQDKMRVVTLMDSISGGMLRTVTIHEDIGRTYIELVEVTPHTGVPASVLPNGMAVPSTAVSGTSKPNPLLPTPLGGTPDSHAPTTGGKATSPFSTEPAPSNTAPIPQGDPLAPPPLIPGGAGVPSPSERLGEGRGEGRFVPP